MSETKTEAVPSSPSSSSSSSSATPPPPDTNDDTSLPPDHLHPPPLPSSTPSISALLSDLRRSKLTIGNRLRSIRTDAEFVRRVAEAFGGGGGSEDDDDNNETKRPVVANERCGSWYVRPADRAGSAYFKSTDGHVRAWKFSTRRLNLHLIDMAERNDGIIIVDSTRRGKRIPDALAATVPIWCAVLNRALLPAHPASRALFLPPSYATRSIHDQIAALLPGFVADLASLDVLRRRPGRRGGCELTKPLRPFWVTPDSTLPDGGGGSRGRGAIFDDFRPVVCCTASRCARPDDDGGDGGWYVQGAGDDAENWALGLTPSLLWRHEETLLGATDEEALSGAIRALVERDRAVSPTTSLEGGRAACTRLTPSSCVACPIFSSSTFVAPAHLESSDGSECHIQLLPSAKPPTASSSSSSSSTPSPLPIVTPSPRLMQVRLGQHKTGSRNLRPALPRISAFARSFIVDSGAGSTAPRQPRIVISCSSGTDLSVGAALALSCLLFDDDYALRPDGGSVVFSKTLVRSRLADFTTTYEAANPSRATLQSVHSFLMDWRT